MSCLTTSATRRSRSVPAAVLIASAAASSHEVLLVPMISVTLYTLITLSFTTRGPLRAAAASLSQRHLARSSMQAGDRGERRPKWPTLAASLVTAVPAPQPSPRWSFARRNAPPCRGECFEFVGGFIARAVDRQCQLPASTCGGPD